MGGAAPSRHTSPPPHKARPRAVFQTDAARVARSEVRVAGVRGREAAMAALHGDATAEQQKEAQEREEAARSEAVRKAKRARADELKEKWRRQRSGIRTIAITGAPGAAPNLHGRPAPALHGLVDAALRAPLPELPANRPEAPVRHRAAPKAPGNGLHGRHPPALLKK